MDRGFETDIVVEAEAYFLMALPEVVLVMKQRSVVAKCMYSSLACRSLDLQADALEARQVTTLHLMVLMCARSSLACRGLFLEEAVPEVQQVLEVVAELVVMVKILVVAVARHAYSSADTAASVV